ncbi:hypothetical protein ACTN1H_004501, partial [Vibrio parahaemolyticus]
LSFGRLPLTLSRLALAVTLSTSQVVVMIVLETEVQNVNVKTLTLRHFAKSPLVTSRLAITSFALNLTSMKFYVVS